MLISCNSNNSKNFSEKAIESGETKVETTKKEGGLVKVDFQNHEISVNHMKIYSMDTESLMEESFNKIFKTYKFEKIGPSRYKNKYCVFRVQIIDQITIRMEFANINTPKEFYLLYPYLVVKLKGSYYDITPSLYTPEYQKYNNEELAIKSFYKYLANFAENQLKEPFTGDFSWDTEYHEVFDFLRNTRNLISENELYSELKPMLKNFEQNNIKKMNQEALRIYYKQKEIIQ